METHVIQKRDLNDMVSRFADDSKIVVKIGRDNFYIASAEYSHGRIKIICHNDIPEPPEEECDCDEMKEMTREVRVFLTNSFGDMTPEQQLDCINKFQCEMGRFIE